MKQQYWYPTGEKNKRGQDIYILYAYKDGKRHRKRWAMPLDYSKKMQERALNKAAIDFARDVHEGKVLYREEIKAQKAQMEAEIARIPTIKDYSETFYMPQKVVTIAENTRDNYERSFRLYINPVIGDLKIDEVKPTQINSILLNMQKSGKAVASVIKVYNVLNNMFKEAYINDFIKVNPMDKVERPKPTKAEKVKKEIEAFTVSEIKQIRQLMEGEELKWQTYINIVIDTGCRNGEAVGLAWEYVDFEACTVRFENNVCYTSKKGVYIDTIKNGKNRTNRISPYTSELLKAMKKEQEMNGIKTRWVFIQDARGGVMHPHSPGHFLVRFGNRYSFKKCRPHKFRHTAVSIMITNGIDVASVAEIVGDNIDTILRIYTHTNEESKSKAFDAYQMALGDDV